MSVRSGAHVIPRWIAGKPYDASDVSPLNRMPWRLMNLVFGLRVARERGAYPASWPSPAHRLLEGIPLISSDILPAVRRGQVIVKPAISSLAGDRVRFFDRTEEVVDRIVYATGYRISVPFLAPSLLAPLGRDLPLYRRIMPPGVFGLYFVGYVDAPGGLLPVVESQAEWLAAVVTGRLAVPPPEQMRQAIDRPEPRTRERFFRGKVRTAFAVIPTPTDACCGRICGARSGQAPSVGLRSAGPHRLPEWRTSSTCGRATSSRAADA
jgi:hypothetical protein